MAKMAIRQASHLENLATATKIAADAAKASADLANKEFIASHRPRLRVHSISVEKYGPEQKVGIGGAQTALRIPPRPLDGSLYVTNVGDSAATIVDSYCSFYSLPKGLPMEPPYSGLLGNEFLAEIRLAAGGTTIGKFTNLFDGTEQSSDMLSGALYVLGWVIYRDDNGTPRRTAFCRWYDPQRRRFAIIEDPDYERED
jgi:hypothetical protein